MGKHFVELAARHRARHGACVNYGAENFEIEAGSFSEMGRDAPLATSHLRHLVDGGGRADPPGGAVPRHDPPRTLEKVYGHHRPDYQSDVSGAFGQRGRRSGGVR